MNIFLMIIMIVLLLFGILSFPVYIIVLGVQEYLYNKKRDHPKSEGDTR